MKDYLVENGIKEIWFLADHLEGQVGTGKAQAKRYEGNWATDVFWGKLAT